MATHLYDTVNELRHQTRLLTTAATAGRFRGSQVGLDSTLAATS